MSAAARVAIVGLVFLAACGGESGTPGPAGPSPGPSPGPARPNALRLEGPSSLAPGVSAQYRVTVLFTDGTTRDVTTESSIVTRAVGASADAVHIGTEGTVTGNNPGEVDITAFYPAGVRSDDGITFAPGTVDSGPIRVLVLEPGTFRVSGVVTDSAGPLPTARISVVAGRRAGLQFQTGPGGGYALYGLAGPTELSVSGEGLQPQVRSLQITDHQVVDFNLQPLSGYDSLTGNWRLVLSTSPSCGSAIPADAAVRTFQARIVQRGALLTMDVSSPARVILAGYPVTAVGGVSGDTMSFRFQTGRIDERNPPWYTLLEALEPGRFLGIGALAEGRRAGNTITGWLSGSFAIYRSTGADYFVATTMLESSCYRWVGEHEQLHSFRLDRE